MVAVPEAGASAPTVQAGAGELARLAHCHRVVAIVDTSVELLRPESDLVRTIAGIGQVDVLVAVDDAPVDPPGPVGVLDPGADGSTGLELLTSDVDEYEDADAFRAEIRAEVDRLGLPGLRVHHLGLPLPLTQRDVPDLVAALSELVGFDPEPGVYCLAPADPSRSVLTSAARRIAQVYGLPLLRYRCLELAVVPEQRPSAGS